MRVAASLLLLCAFAAAEDIYCRVAYVAKDAVYVDAGAARGLRPGDLGVIRRNGQEIAAVEVITTSKSQARLRILRRTKEPIPGDRAIFARRDGETTSTPAPEKKTAQKKKNETEEFVPLLERQKQAATATAERNIFHGRLTAAALAHLDNESGNFDYTTFLLGSSGMLDRIGGTPWALRWSGNLSYRGGSAFDNSELKGARLDLYEFAFLRRVAQDASVRIGRFLPRTLATAGYFDGVDAEFGTRRFRLGGALGFKPTRDDLSPSADEPTALAYVTFSSGTPGATHYSGTVGLLVSLFKGDLDRTALLFDQFFRSGKFHARASGEIDFDVNSSMVTTGTRLTRLNSYAAWGVLEALTLRIGADRWERLDTGAERAILGIFDPTLFDDGFWRTFVAFDLTLAARWRIDAEVALISTDGAGSTTHWRAALNYLDPFGIQGGTLTLTIYNMEGFDGTGVGGQLSAFLPLSGARWMIHPSLGLRAFDAANGGSLDLTDFRLRVEYTASNRWSFRGGVTYLVGESVDSFLFEIGLTYRW